MNELSLSLARRLRFVLALTVMGLGVTCGPRDPGPGCPTCPPGTITGCRGGCVAPIPLGGACAADPCGPLGPCVAGASCVGGVCTNLGLALGSDCTTAEPNDVCPSDLFCKSITCLTGTSLRGPICASPAAAGSSCDGDVDKVGGTPSCSPCAPGTTCVRKEIEGPGVCHALCNSDADCCGRAANRCSTGLTAASPPVAPGVCFACKKLRDADCGPESPCCDGSTCSRGYSDLRARCCQAEGQSCIASATCCPGSVCRARAVTGGTSGTGACGPCVPLGEACVDAGECCEGLCLGGKCKKPCIVGAPCTADGAKGECAKGTTTCSALGDATCKPSAPKPETCDGKDNDCDGTIDNIPADACSTSPSGCQAGFTVSGTYRCSGGKKVCDVQFCGGGVGGTPCNGKTASGDYCGTCAATPCVYGSTVAQCVPNMACSDDTYGPQCKRNYACIGSDPPACWLPKDVGKCLP